MSLASDAPVPATLVDGPPAGATWLGHPRGLFLLFIVEMWERFSYYGMRALLVLYLMEGVTSGNPGRGWAEGEANLLYGWYTGLAYLLPLAGGHLADRFLGTHRSMLIGAVIITLGHIALAISGLGGLGASKLGMSVFVGGLALIVIGTGYFKPCVSVMVGQLYAPNDPRREGAFTIFYMGINLGAFICAFVCGTLGETVGWHWGFGSAAVGMIAGLGVYLWGRPMFLKGIGEPRDARYTYTVPFFAASLVLVSLVTLAFHFGGFGQLSTYMDWLFGYTVAQAVLALAVLGGIAWFIRIQLPEDRGPTGAIFILILFNAFFWIAFEQAGSTLNVFAKQDTNRTLLSWDVPATWFQSVNPLLIFLLAPLFAGLWQWLGVRGKDPSQPVKLGIGLLLVGAGYVFMVIAAMKSQTGAVSMFWLLATYTLHTVGELYVSPTGLSFVTKVAPVRFASLLMGFWFISSFLANYGGGKIASYVQDIESGQIELFWYPWFRLGGRADYFLMFVISSIGGGLAILLLTPVVKRILHGREG